MPLTNYLLLISIWAHAGDKRSWWPVELWEHQNGQVVYPTIMCCQWVISWLVSANSYFQCTTSILSQSTWDENPWPCNMHVWQSLGMPSEKAGWESLCGPLMSTELMPKLLLASGTEGEVIDHKSKLITSVISEPPWFVRLMYVASTGDSLPQPRIPSLNLGLPTKL